ncbi:MAG: Zn-dependent alcohol dehydrogenase [Sphingomonadaceae bacterium]|nr:Zn-dependent alcohol dehydrogenase [Sphingomonadaceae bacterium]
MKAAVLHEVKTPLAIEDVAITTPGPREILIRTAAVGVCRSDLHFIDGVYPYPLPTIPGHEAAGVVEAVGSEVRRIKVGDHVVTCLSAFCGACEHCVTGHLSLCTDPSVQRGPDAAPKLTLGGKPVNQFLNLSAFAEMMLVHENAAVTIDRDMPLTQAALIGCAVTTGAGAVFNDCRIRPGESVAVIGCGGIGLAAINAARIAGAGRIIAIDPLESKRSLAMKLGATDAFDPGMDKAHQAIVEATGGGVHHAIEAVGRPASAELAWNILRRGGQAVIVGMIPPGQNVSIHGPTFLQGKGIKGSLMGSNRFPVDLPRLVDFYLKGQLDLDSIIAERTDLNGINDAVDKLRQGDAVRSVVVFG